MRLLVVGAGSTGGYLGARLAEAGQDVSFLVRAERAAQLCEHGLRIRNQNGDTTLHPPVVTAAGLREAYDAILLTVRSYQLNAAMEDIAPAVGPETMILPVLNGMRHMDLLSRRFALRNVVGCALKVATQLEADGTIVQLTPMQDFAYGELDGPVTPRIALLDQFLKSADIGARLSADIHREMWEKWVLLASLGAATCLLRGPVGAIEVCPGGAGLVLRLIDEIVAIITAVGKAPTDAFLEGTREQLTAKGSPLASSMYRDLQRGRDVEVEAILGDLVRHGGDLGYDSPLLSAAYANLRVYQNALAAAGKGSAPA